MDMEGKGEDGTGKWTDEERETIARFVQRERDLGFLSFSVEYCDPDGSEYGDVVCFDGGGRYDGWSVHKTRQGYRLIRAEGWFVFPLGSLEELMK